jgi:hypothetical protein
MRKPKFTIFATIVGFIVMIAAYALFQSVVHSTTYLVTLDRVLSAAVGELWKFISNPTIFIAFVVGGALWTFRKNIQSILYAISEIKVGDFSTKIDREFIAKITKSEVQMSQAVDLPKSKEKREDITDYLLSRLGKEILEFMLHLDGKRYELNEIFAKMKEHGIGKHYLGDYEGFSYEELFTYIFGSWLGISKIVFPVMYDVKIHDTDPDSFTTVEYHLKPGIYAKIHERLVALEKQQLPSGVRKFL